MIVITVEGGMVQEAYCSNELCKRHGANVTIGPVVIVDYDTEGADPKDLEADDDGKQCYVERVYIISCQEFCDHMRIRLEARDKAEDAKEAAKQEGNNNAKPL